MGFHSRKSSDISQYLSEWDEALWQYREVATTRMTTPASTPTPSPEGGTCNVCGAVIGETVGSRDTHDEWHDTMTQAIKEQVEEALKEHHDEALKEQAEARAALLLPTMPNMPMHRPRRMGTMRNCRIR